MRAARHRIEPADCVLIGDSAHDARAARAAGALFISVPYGYGAAGDFGAARSVASLLHAAELLGKG